MILHSLLLNYRNQPRRVRVFLPPRPSKRLLILFDGQNIFEDHGSYAGGWHTHEVVAGLPKTVDQPLVVALDHGHHHRNRELWADLPYLLDFLLHPLLPTLRDRWDFAGPVTLGGASLGGLAALAGHFRYPEIFGAALCISPSFWFDQGAIFRELPSRPLGKVYIDVGRKEGRLMYPMALRMVEELQRRSFGEEELLWRPDKRGRHNEAHWRRRLPKALKCLFRREKKVSPEGGP